MSATRPTASELDLIQSLITNDSLYTKDTAIVTDLVRDGFDIDGSKAELAQSINFEVSDIKTSSDVKLTHTIKKLNDLAMITTGLFCKVLKLFHFAMGTIISQNTNKLRVSDNTELLLKAGISEKSTLSFSQIEKRLAQLEKGLDDLDPEKFRDTADVTTLAFRINKLEKNYETLLGGDVSLSDTQAPDLQNIYERLDILDQQVSGGANVQEDPGLISAVEGLFKSVQALSKATPQEPSPNQNLLNAVSTSTKTNADEIKRIASLVNSALSNIGEVKAGMGAKASKAEMEAIKDQISSAPQGSTAKANGTAKAPMLKSMDPVQFRAFREMFKTHAKAMSWSEGFQKNQVMLLLDPSIHAPMKLALKDFESLSIKDIFDKWEQRICPESLKSLAVMQLESLKQSLDESHSDFLTRATQLYLRVYGDTADPELDTTFCQKLINGIRDHRLKDHIRRMKPKTITELRDSINSEVAIQLLSGVYEGAAEGLSIGTGVQAMGAPTKAPSFKCAVCKENHKTENCNVMNNMFGAFQAKFQDFFKNKNQNRQNNRGRGGGRGNYRGNQNRGRGGNNRKRKAVSEIKVEHNFEPKTQKFPKN